MYLYFIVFQIWHGTCSYLHATLIRVAGEAANLNSMATLNF